MQNVLPVFAFVAMTMGASLAGAAEPSHGSCAGGAPGAVAELGLPIAPGPGFGTGFVKPIAQAGAAKETIETLHAAYCEPRPSSPQQPN
jgi:hypothetical protein